MMKTWLTTIFSDEEGPDATEGKTVILSGSKKQIKELADFFKKVSKYLDSNDYCHMHFRDYETNWNKKNYIDLEINVEKT